MLVFQLRLDCEKCDGTGMALVAAPSFEQAVRHYERFGDAGDDVANGLVVFSKDSEFPIDGLEYHGCMRVLCDCFCFEQEV